MAPMFRTLALICLALPALAAAPTLKQCQQVGPLRLGLPEKQFSSKLGKPASESKPRLEAASGLTIKERSYPKWGLKLVLSHEQAKDPWKVERFTVTAPCPWKTPQGLGIGSSDEEVRKTYAELLDSEQPSSDLVVGSIYDGVIFSVEDHKVKSIFVGAAAE